MDVILADPVFSNSDMLTQREVPVFGPVERYCLNECLRDSTRESIAQATLGIPRAVQEELRRRMRSNFLYEFIKIKKYSLHGRFQKICLARAFSKNIAYRGVFRNIAYPGVFKKYSLPKRFQKI